MPQIMMLRIVRNSTMSILIGLLLLMSLSRMQAQRVLPLPPVPPNSEVNQQWILRTLSAPLEAKDISVVLAQVVSIKIKPTNDELYRRRNLIMNIVVGGRLRVLETLDGTPMRETFIDVEDEKRPLIPPGTVIYNTSKFGIRWNWLRVGNYLLIYMKQGIPFKDREENHPGIQLNNRLNDPVLVQYRRCLAWRRIADKQRAHQEEEAVLLNSKETLSARCVALWTRVFGERLPTPSKDEPELLLKRKEVNRALVQLLAQMRLPHVLREEAIKTVWLNLSKPLAADSDEAMLARYLLHTAAHCPDNELVYAAADRIVMLANNAPQGMTGYGPQVYLFPNILQVLRERAQRSDDAKCAQAAGAALWSYQRSHQVRPNTPYEKHAPYISRAIPPFGNTPLERNLKMAAVTL